MARRFSSALFALAASFSLAGFLALGAAAQSSSGGGTTPGISPQGSPCFDQFTDRLQQCRNLFCMTPASCNETLLGICAQGALAELEACLENSSS